MASITFPDFTNIDLELVRGFETYSDPVIEPAQVRDILICSSCEYRATKMAENLTSAAKNYNRKQFMNILWAQVTITSEELRPRAYIPEDQEWSYPSSEYTGTENKFCLIDISDEAGYRVSRLNTMCPQVPITSHLLDFECTKHVVASKGAPYNIIHLLDGRTYSAPLTYEDLTSHLDWRGITNSYNNINDFCPRKITIERANIVSAAKRLENTSATESSNVDENENGQLEDIRGICEILVPQKQAEYYLEPQPATLFQTNFTSLDEVEFSPMVSPDIGVVEPAKKLKLETTLVLTSLAVGLVFVCCLQGSSVTDPEPSETQGLIITLDDAGKTLWTNKQFGKFIPMALSALFKLVITTTGKSLLNQIDRLSAKLTQIV